MLESIMKLIDVMDGLTINFTVGQESELVIKGDFKAMAKFAAIVSKQQSDGSEARQALRDLHSN
jgi:hypothetical protein